MDKLHTHQPNPPLPNLARIERIILAGLMESVRSLFDIPKAQIIFFATTNRMQIADRIKKMREGASATLTWPIVFVHVTGFAPAQGDDLHAVNPRHLARTGINVHLADTQNTVLNVKIVPVVFECELIYMDDDWDRSFRYGCEWMAAAQANKLNYSITYHNYDLDIRVKMGDSFSTPDREEAVNQSNQFEYSSTLQIGGFVQASGADAVSKVSVIRQIKGDVVPQPATGEPPTGYSPATQLPVVTAVPRPKR